MVWCVGVSGGLAVIDSVNVAPALRQCDMNENAHARPALTSPFTPSSPSASCRQDGRQTDLTYLPLVHQGPGAVLGHGRVCQEKAQLSEQAGA
jgi:hypothetical protein